MKSPQKHSLNKLLSGKSSETLLVTAFIRCSNKEHREEEEEGGVEEGEGGEKECGRASSQSY